MNVLIAGASGLIGRALAAELRARGHVVQRLVRRASSAPEEIAWDPAAGRLESAALAGVDAIVNLAGENLASERWTARRRESLRRSRVDATRTLVLALKNAGRKPAVFVSASAVGFYGDRGDEVLTEASAPGAGFLPEICLAWETHAEGAARLGVRTALLRFGVVLAAEGGALAQMLPLFRLGLGGRLGAGRQWMSWIARADAITAVRVVLENESWRGPLNVVAPAPVRNAEFTAALARALRRPAILPAPAWALRLAFGRMADEALLASTRAQPERLLAGGFEFRHLDLAGALAAILRAPPRA
jgi:uncharacterized protein (TIGR01777 family)